LESSIAAAAFAARPSDRARRPLSGKNKNACTIVPGNALAITCFWNATSRTYDSQAEAMPDAVVKSPSSDSE